MKDKDIIKLTFREISYQQMSRKKLFNIEIIFVGPLPLSASKKCHSCCCGLLPLLFLRYSLFSFILNKCFVVFVILAIIILANYILLGLFERFYGLKTGFR